MALEIEMA